MNDRSAKPTPDANDLQATVPVKGWDGAETVPASAPASGSGPSTDQTLPMQLNRPAAVPEADPAATRAGFGDTQDLQATVPAKGWDGAATQPASAPASGSGPSSDATLPMQFNRPEADATGAGLTRGGAPDPQATLFAGQTQPARQTLAGNEAATLPGGTRPTTGSFTANDEKTLVGTGTGQSGTGTGGTGGGAGGTGSFTQSGTKSFSGSFTRGGTRMGRTRINNRLQLTDQQLDERLQMSRTSVLTDMASARGDAAVSKGLQKLVTDQGTDARYHISRPLAAGGMGAVLHIEDNDFRRGAAMKVMHGKFTNDPQALERFLAEAQVTAQLEHPNIVPIHDMGVMPDGSLYFTMKLIEGISLGDVVKTRRVFTGLLTQEDYIAEKVKKESQKPAETRKSQEKILADYAEDKATGEQMAARFPVSETLLMFLKVLDGVGFAHSRGVVHRDIKPDNIMLGAHGEVLVVDWGIAKVLHKADRDNEFVKRIEKEVVSLRGAGAISETMAGSAMGTLFYMPPEQARGDLDQVDGRSDIYALGATLYELLSLKRSIEARSMGEALAMITTGDWIPLNRQAPELDKDLVAIVHRAMAFDPTKRYQDCTDFADDIRRYLAGSAVLARRRNLIERIGAWVAAHKRQVQFGAIGVALVVVAVGGTVWIYAHQQEAAFTAKLTEATTRFEEAKKADDLDGMRSAKGILDTASGILPDDPRLSEPTTAFALAIDQKEGELKRASEAKTRLAVARSQFEEAKKLKAEKRYKEAEIALSSALTADPGNAEYDRAREDIRALLKSELLQEQTRQAKDLRDRGDAALATAAKLDPAEAKVAELLDSAKKDYDQLEKLPPQEGTQEQLRLLTELRLKAEQARERKRLAAEAGPLKETARKQLAAGDYVAARAAIEQARGKTPDDQQLDVLLQQLVAAETRAEEEKRTADARKNRDQALAMASGAEAAGNFDEALTKIALALTHVPNDQAALDLREKVRGEKAAAELAARRTKAVAEADTALTAARGEQQAAEGEQRKALEAQARVAQLERELGRAAIGKKQPLFDAVAAAKAARTAFDLRLTQAEAKANAALTGLAEFPADAKTAEARTVLCQLYVVRLRDARRSRNESAIGAYTSLIRRTDPDGSFKRVLDNVGQITVSGKPPAAVLARRLMEGPDTRLVPSGDPVTLVPGAASELPAGSYELRSGDQLISVVVDGGENRTVPWPGPLPVVKGVPLAYVPANGTQKAFALGVTEVTVGQYVEFLNDPKTIAAIAPGYRQGRQDGRSVKLTYVPFGVKDNDLVPLYFQVGPTKDDDTKLGGFRVIPSTDVNTPIGKVSRDDAEAYCRWLSTASGLKVRLPKAREWQFAANGGDDSRLYPWGSFFVPQFTISALVVGTNQMAQPVKSAPTDRGPFGHYDLAGNLREWLGDTERDDGTLAAGASGALIAGGSYSGDNPVIFTTTYTESVEPAVEALPIGFRVLVELP